jgi:hypothetical protein
LPRLLEWVVFGFLVLVCAVDRSQGFAVLGILESEEGHSEGHFGHGFAVLGILGSEGGHSEGHFGHGFAGFGALECLCHYDFAVFVAYAASAVFELYL